MSSPAALEPAPEPLRQQAGRVLAGRRGQLVGVYLLMLGSEGAGLLAPWLIGLAIDRRRWAEVAALGAFWLATVGLSHVRRVVDTRVFSRLYAAWATEVVAQQRASGVAPSQLIARAALSREFVDFLEREVPMVVAMLVALLGPLSILLALDPLLGGVALAALGLTVTGGVYAARWSLAFHGGLHSQLEREVEVLAGTSAHAVEAHYRELATWRIRLSNLDALTFSAVQLLGLGLIALVLLRSSADASSGSVFALVTYTLSFLSALASIPAALQQASRLRDIAQRLRTPASAAAP